MAAAVVEQGSLLRHSDIKMVSCKLTTAANGEDGVTWVPGFQRVLASFACGAEGGADSSFSSEIGSDNQTLTITAPAGAGGDAKLVSVLAIGY